MEKTVIGIAGLGWWGPKLLRNFQNHQCVDKIYGYDISEEAIDNVLNQGLNFIQVQTYSNLLENVSSVVIATPPKTHFELVNKALEGGKNVLVTKPPCETMTEIDILAQHVKGKDLAFMVDATYVYNPVLETVFNLLQKKRMKNLRSLRILRFGDDLRKHHISRLEKTMFANNVDIIKDLLFHDISILIYLFGNEIKVESIKTLNNLHNSFSDSAILFLEAQKIPIIIEYSWTFPERRREFQFYYDDRFFIFDDLNQSEKLWEFSYEDKKKHSIYYKWNEPLFCVVDHFLTCIREKSGPRTGIHFMKNVMEIMSRINGSMKSTA